MTITIFIRGTLIEDRPVDGPQAEGTYPIKIDTPTIAMDAPLANREFFPELYASIQKGRYRQWTKFAPSD